MLDIIDLNGVGTGDPVSLRRVAVELGRACRETGFFYVQNHGIPDRLLSDAFASAKRFFSSPVSAKNEFSITLSPHNRGYVGIAGESLNLAETDQKEAFNIGLDLLTSDPEVVARKPF